MSLTISTPGDLEIVMVREFAAPRRLVFAALTTPQLLRRWFGPHGHELVQCEIDLRVGGAWRYVVRAPNGSEMRLHGVYREIVVPERLVSTEANDDCDAENGAVQVGTTVLTEVDGRTTLTTTIVYPSKEIRDAVLNSGMERGVGEGYDRLASALDLAAVADRYSKRADLVDEKIAKADPARWDDQSPCEEWTARGVVGHIVDMHQVIMRPLDREPTPAPSVDEDPLAAFRTARADIESLLSDPAIATRVVDTPGGTMTVAEHIDQVPSADLVLHGWDLACALGQDDTMDPDEVANYWSGMSSMPVEQLETLRTPEAFGPGVVVFGPEVKVPDDAPLQDRLLGLIGRDRARWRPRL